MNATRQTPRNPQFVLRREKGSEASGTRARGLASSIVTDHPACQDPDGYRGRAGMNAVDLALSIGLTAPVAAGCWPDTVAFSPAPAATRRAVRSHRGGTAALERGLGVPDPHAAGDRRPATPQPDDGRWTGTGGGAAQRRRAAGATIANGQRRSPDMNTHAPRPKRPGAGHPPGDPNRAWGPSTANCRLVD